MRGHSGDSGVAGEGRVAGISKFHSWGKCTMPLTNSNSDWRSNASSGCILHRSKSYISHCRSDG